jgi:hypothetical protein
VRLRLRQGGLGPALALDAGDGGTLTARSPIAKFFSAEEIAALANEGVISAAPHRSS